MSRVLLYVPQGGSLSEVLALQERARVAGIEVTECAVGKDWSEVLALVAVGDELVVGSLSCFTSLNELLGFVAQSGARVRSLDDPWFSGPVVAPQDYLCRLYELGSMLHAARTHRGLAQAARQGRLPGRRVGSKGAVRVDEGVLVAQVDRLRVEHKLTVAEACAQAGVSVNGYYRSRKQKR